MKLPWLLPALIGRGGAASTLDTDIIVAAAGNEIFGSDGQGFFEKSIQHILRDDPNTYVSVKQCSQDTAPASSPNPNAVCVYHVTFANIHTYTRPNHTTPQQSHEDSSIETLSVSHSVPAAGSDDDSEIRQSVSSPDAKAPSTPLSPPSEKKEPDKTRNPAPVNRAIAGTGAALVGVMLVFTVFF